MAPTERKVKGHKPLLRYYDETEPVSGRRSRTMSSIRGKHTQPELLLRKALWAEGLRFRVHDRSLPGTPDISNKSRQVAVFVDGCFWHGCPQHFKAPKTRSRFWKEKIRRNREKRSDVIGAYGEGWRIHQFFECGLEPIGRAVDEVINGWHD